MGDPIEQAFVRNESGVPVVVTAVGGGHTDDARLVPPGASGLAYTVGGLSDGRQVSVLTADCTLMAETTNDAHLLLITINPDSTVTFEQGANLTLLEHVGSITETTACH